MKNNHRKLRTFFRWLFSESTHSFCVYSARYLALCLVSQRIAAYPAWTVLLTRGKRGRKERKWRERREQEKYSTKCPFFFVL